MAHGKILHKTFLGNPGLIIDQISLKIRHLENFSLKIYVWFFKQKCSSKNPALIILKIIFLKIRICFWTKFTTITYIWFSKKNPTFGPWQKIQFLSPENICEKIIFGPWKCVLKYLCNILDMISFPLRS